MASSPSDLTTGDSLGHAFEVAAGPANVFHTLVLVASSSMPVLHSIRRMLGQMMARLIAGKNPGTMPKHGQDAHVVRVSL